MRLCPVLDAEAMSIVEADGAIVNEDTQTNGNKVGAGKHLDQTGGADTPIAGVRRKVKPRKVECIWRIARCHTANNALIMFDHFVAGQVNRFGRSPFALRCLCKVFHADLFQPVDLVDIGRVGSP